MSAAANGVYVFAASFPQQYYLGGMAKGVVTERMEIQDPKEHEHCENHNKSWLANCRQAGNKN